MGGKGSGRKYDPQAHARARENYKFVTVRIPIEDWKETKNAAERTGRSLNETIVTYITWGNETERSNQSKPLQKPPVGGGVHSSNGTYELQPRQRR